MAIPPALRATQGFGQAARCAPLRRARPALRRENLGGEDGKGQAPPDPAEASLEGSAKR